MLESFAFKLTNATAPPTAAASAASSETITSARCAARRARTLLLAQRRLSRAHSVQCDGAHLFVLAHCARADASKTDKPQVTSMAALVQQQQAQQQQHAAQQQPAAAQPNQHSRVGTQPTDPVRSGEYAPRRPPSRRDARPFFTRNQRSALRFVSIRRQSVAQLMNVPYFIATRSISERVAVDVAYQLDAVCVCVCVWNDGDLYVEPGARFIAKKRRV